MEKIGIENLKKAIGFAIKFGMKIEEKFDDGKMTFWEGLGLVPELKDILDIVKNAKSIKDEFLDLDDSEKDELVSFVKANFDLKNEKAENIVVRSVDTVSSISLLVFELSSVGGGGAGDDPTDPDPDDNDVNG